MLSRQLKNIILKTLFCAAASFDNKKTVESILYFTFSAVGIQSGMQISKLLKR